MGKKKKTYASSAIDAPASLLIPRSALLLVHFKKREILQQGILSQFAWDKRQGTPWAGLTQRQTTIHIHIHAYEQFRITN